MRFVTVCGLISTALFTTACAIDHAGKTPAQIAQELRVVDSEFDKSRLLAAPVLMGDGAGVLGPTYSAKLVAVQNKSTGAIEHALHVQWTYSGDRWMFFSGATLSGGVDLKTAVGQRNASSCSGRRCIYEETVTAAMPLEVLSGAAEVKVRFSSENGYAIVTLPSNYVAGYREGVATLTGKHAGAQ